MFRSTALLSLALGWSSVFAIRFPHFISVEFTNKGSSTSDPYQFGNLNNGGNQQIYVGTITLGGKSYEVQLDTGSSDLWIDTTGVDVSGFTDTGEKGFVQYGDTTVATGPILLGNVTFGDFVVEKQAFISAAGTNATSNGDKGLLGLGPPKLSAIADTLNNTKYNGNSFLDNVFSAYPDEPNFMTFMLSRSTIGTTDGGVFTIGVVNSSFSDVQKANKLPVESVTNQWVILVDAVIINGQKLDGGSFVPSFATQTVALLDTGNSQDTAPPKYVDAMFGSINGAQVDDSGTYTVPCDSKVDITFVIGGQEFPINPIDAVFAAVDPTSNEIVCTGAWSYGDSNSTGNDIALGDPFLRNVYSLFDFGNYTNVGDTAPFIQLLSLTKAAEADAEFEKLNQARLAELTAAAKSANKGGTAAKSSSGVKSQLDSGSSSNGEMTSTEANALIRNSYIIIGFLGVVVAILLLLVILTMRMGRRNGPPAPGFAVPFSQGQKYSTLYDQEG